MTLSEMFVGLLFLGVAFGFLVALVAIFIEFGALAGGTATILVLWQLVFGDPSLPQSGHDAESCDYCGDGDSGDGGCGA